MSRRWAVVVAAVLAIGAVRSWAHRAPAAAPGVLAVPAPATSGTRVAYDARQLLGAVDARRAAGYGDPASADPAEWAAPTCTCLAVERARLSALRRAGHRLGNARITLVEATVVGQRGDRVEILVTDRIPPYDEIDARGSVVRRWRGRGDARWRVMLVRTDGHWRLAEITTA